MHFPALSKLSRFLENGDMTFYQYMCKQSKMEYYFLLLARYVPNVAKEEYMRSV